MSYSFLLVAKYGHTEAAALAETMQSWLEARGSAVMRRVHSDPDASWPSSLRTDAEKADVVLVLGGDGTFIGVARQLAGISTVIMGINFGRVGFLTEVSMSDWRPTLEAILDKRLMIVPRTLLSWRHERGGEVLHSGHAVNDAVVGRGRLARVAGIHVAVGAAATSESKDEDRFVDIGLIRADGVLVSSALGSSAYSLSAGGPLVQPDVPALLINAIAPFLGSLPPLVIPETSCVRLQCSDAQPDAELCLTVDGQEGYALMPGDNVFVRGMPGGLRLLTGAGGGYLENLRRRGFIREFGTPHPTEKTV